MASVDECRHTDCALYARDDIILGIPMGLMGFPWEWESLG